MDIKEFYTIQNRYNLTNYTNSNLELILKLLNENKDIKPPIATFKEFIKIGYVVNKGNKAIGFIKYPIIDKKTNKTYFRKKAIFGFNQVKKLE